MLLCFRYLYYFLSSVAIWSLLASIDSIITELAFHSETEKGVSL